MNFKEVKSKFKDHLMIDSQAISLSKKPDYLRRQISEWKEKGWLVELKRGIYVINDPYFIEKISNLYIANKIYFPSYISLEYALFEYELIPEKVNLVTSVSTRKTTHFKNHFGTFLYKTIKKELFFGFKEITRNNSKILFATREKALLDFLYLNLNQFKRDKHMNILKEYRFQNLGSLRMKELNSYLKRFKNKKLEEIVKCLKDHKKEERYRKV